MLSEGGSSTSAGRSGGVLANFTGMQSAEDERAAAKREDDWVFMVLVSMGFGLEVKVMFGMANKMKYHMVNHGTK